MTRKEIEDQLISMLPILSYMAFGQAMATITAVRLIKESAHPQPDAEGDKPGETTIKPQDAS